MPPEGWTTRSIADLLSMHYSGEWGSDPHGAGNASVLRATNMVENSLVYETAAPRAIPSAVLARKKLRPGDLLLEASGGSPDQPVGRIARFAPDAAPYGDYICSNFFRTLRTDPNVVESRYAELLLQSLATGPGIRPLQRQTTGIINLDFARYLNTRITLPVSLDEQRRIIEILDAAEEERLVAQRRTSRQRTAHEALREHLLEQHSSATAVPLAECCGVISRGKAPTYVARSPLRAIGQRCVRWEGFNAEVSRPHAATVVSGMLFAQPDDVLINSTGTGTLGRVCQFDGPPNRFIVDGHVTLLRPNSNARAEFLSAWLSSPRTQRVIEVRCVTGSTNQIELDRTKLAALEIPLPNCSVQESVAQALKASDELLRAMAARIGQLSAVERALKSDLLTGRVRV